MSDFLKDYQEQKKKNCYPRRNLLFFLSKISKIMCSQKVSYLTSYTKKKVDFLHQKYEKYSGLQQVSYGSKSFLASQVVKGRALFRVCQKVNETF